VARCPPTRPSGPPARRIAFEDSKLDTERSPILTATPTPPSKPLLCRLNIHHHWRVEHAPEGGNYRRCTKCGKDDPGGFTEGRPGDIIAGGGA
jgi:hypothetical protein